MATYDTHHSKSSLSSLDTVTIVDRGVKEQTKPGPTLNRAYRWLGFHLERGLVAAGIEVKRHSTKGTHTHSQTNSKL